MRTATKKQAIYLNRLTYKLYMLDEYRDTNLILPYKNALGLTYDVADDMIKNVKARIKELEVQKYLNDITNTTEYKKLEEFPTLKMVENFKKIDKFKVDKEAKTAEITTVDGNTYKISGDDIRTHDFCLTYGEIYTMLKRAIDNDFEVGILQTDKYTVITPSDKMCEYTREMYLKQIELWNRILKLTNGYLPATEEGKVNKESFAVLLDLIEIVDTNFYQELNKQYEKDKLRVLIDLYIKSRTHEYNIVRSNDNVIM